MMRISEKYTVDNGDYIVELDTSESEDCQFCVQKKGSGTRDIMLMSVSDAESMLAAMLQILSAYKGGV